MTSLKIYLAQGNPVVGDISGNIEKARQNIDNAKKLDADIVLFPELFVSGYPPEDLVLKPAFQQACREAVETLAGELSEKDPGVILGAPWVEEGKLYNSVCLLANGKIEAVRHKVDLPNYSVFDEKRVFSAGPLPTPVEFKGVNLGLPICEDIWHEGIDENICLHLKELGADILLVANGSPYADNKSAERMKRAQARVAETGLPMVYVNQVGGQDELVFDGRSFVLQADGNLQATLAPWREDQRLTEWNFADGHWQCCPGEVADIEDQGLEDVYQACVLGLKDYVTKNHFPGVVLGLSGGIDSALCAAIAVDALGPEKLHCVMLPYTYTSSESLDDAAACAKALGIRYDSVPIQNPVEAVETALSEMFAGKEADVTEENIQSRLRGVILMAISNKFGHMVVTTGNKSEMSVGYATLYGDMNGGFNPIKDLYKTQVYAVSQWRNENLPQGCLGPEGEVVPSNILTKAPSAELRPDQTDQDSLPPYDALDDILECLVEKEMSAKDIVDRGHAPETVSRIQHLLYIAEYKRRQAAPGIKLTTRHFGRDRRYPITNGFRDQ